jgi:hypothetical protein
MLDFVDTAISKNQVARLEKIFSEANKNFEK